jgi:hypothetical protein
MTAPKIVRRCAFISRISQEDVIGSTVRRFVAQHLRPTFAGFFAKRLTFVVRNRASLIVKAALGWWRRGRSRW